MSGYFRQLRSEGEAERLLREKLTRKQMGNAAYDKEVSYHDDRAFKKFGIVFIVLFAVVVLGVILLG